MRSSFARKKWTEFSKAITGCFVCQIKGEAHRASQSFTYVRRCLLLVLRLCESRHIQCCGSLRCAKIVPGESILWGLEIKVVAQCHNCSCRSLSCSTVFRCSDCE